MNLLSLYLLTSSFVFAIEASHVRVQSAVVQTINPALNDTLFIAIGKKDVFSVNGLESLFKDNRSEIPDVHAKSSQAVYDYSEGNIEKGLTVLVAAIAYMKNDVESLKFFVERGADVNAKSKYGIIPLMIAAARGYVEMVRFLLEHGADITLRDDRGRSADDYASVEVRTEFEKRMRLPQRRAAVRALLQSFSQRTAKQKDISDAVESTIAEVQFPSVLAGIVAEYVVDPSTDVDLENISEALAPITQQKKSWCAIS